MKKLAIAAAAAAALLSAGSAFAEGSTFTFSSYPAPEQAQPSEPVWQKAPLKGWPASNLDIPDTPTPTSAAASVTPGLRVEVGAAVEHESYETDSADGQHKYEAVLPGVKLGVAQTLHNGDEIAGSVSYFRGTSSASGVAGADGLDRSELHVDTHYTWQTGLFQTALLLGVGYRMVDDEGVAPSGKYTRRNHRLFASVGVARPFRFAQAWTVTPRLEYRHILLGRQYSDLGSGASVREHGFGAEAAVDITYRSGGRDLVFTPYARMWNVSSSGAGAMAASKSRTREVGVALTIRF
ncbi:autotransporter domain-containing protein [Burkholderia ambifaria]|uniref:autotransporter domain-containing protein n=1 Tax=Burkholderia ambifaria TaxID=152480 RepID=UPI000F80A429|nr:autotransporter domain-containing protein [Burkholderia ambifaria]